MEAALIGRAIMACCARCSDHHTVKWLVLNWPQTPSVIWMRRESETKIQTLITKVPRDCRVKGIRQKHKRAASSSALMCWWNKRLVKRKWRSPPSFASFVPRSPARTHARGRHQTQLAHINFLHGGGVLCFLLIWRSPQFCRCSGSISCSRVYMRMFWLLT